MGCKKILVVEEQKNITELLESRLSGDHIEIEVVYDAKIAEQILVNRVFDLVILAIRLPAASKKQLCRLLRNEHENIPVLIIGSESEPAGTNANEESEGYEHVGRPLVAGDLVSKVGILLNRVPSKIRPSINLLKACDLVMHIDSRQVYRAGERIALTDKEFQLLAYLLRNKNRVVSRIDLAMNVWDIDFKTGTNVIDVYINYVRNKVDKNFTPKLIQTQIGKGYILKDHAG